ncbi:amidohydrolase 3 [Colletotrichum truncatum]|uniref:Amidohydrolase 3 n=1 Tax=Colletotrichum truncatum TaxID=5467 RepID=A0ACC3YHD9_COLTU|nr:amidohydrolase 3 [Colletotrichum truncatum]KAF6792842.1 amidohydrolase 3 [Colletotrichum truncatum]
MAPYSLLFRAKVVIFALVPSVLSASVPPGSVADFVFQNGSIYTLDEHSNRVSTLAVKDGIIIYAGNDTAPKDLIGNSTQVLDLGGRMAMPGLVDTHLHALQAGQNMLRCNFNYQRLNKQQVLDHLQTCLDSDPSAAPDAWLDAVNLNYMALTAGGESLSKLDLDPLSATRPISLRSNDFHTFVLNTPALAFSNITSTTPFPPGGTIEYLPGTREPSGILLDGANILIGGPPRPTDEENAEAARAALQVLRENGITTWQDALATESGGLSSRGYFDYRIQPPANLEAVDALVSETVALLASRNDNSTITRVPTLKWQAIKALVDGVPVFSARTAALTEPYLIPVANGTNGTQVWGPDPGPLPAPYWNAEVLAKTLEGFFLNDVDAQLHVTGDHAVHISLDAAEAHLRAHPNRREIRLALAHCTLTLEEDWPRFAQLGVDGVFSHQWSQPSPMWLPDTFNSFGPDRLDNVDAYAEIQDAGRPAVYGSDWPVDPLDVWLALKAGVTRSGDPENINSPASIGEAFRGTFPGRGISREAALRAHTINGARFLRADSHFGSLEVGKLADIIVIENNFFEVPDETLGRNRVLFTMVGGEVVYVEDGAQRSFAAGITPKFPNNNTVALKMARRNLGGDLRHLDAAGRADVAKLRKRGDCGSGHAH